MKQQFNTRDYGIKKQCKICGKEIIVANKTAYAYKKRQKNIFTYFCSWSCMQKYERAKGMSLRELLIKNKDLYLCEITFIMTHYEKEKNKAVTWLIDSEVDKALERNIIDLAYLNFLVIDYTIRSVRDSKGVYIKELSHIVVVEKGAKDDF